MLRHYPVARELDIADRQCVLGHDVSPVACWQCVVLAAELDDKKRHVSDAELSRAAVLLRRLHGCGFERFQQVLERGLIGSDERVEAWGAGEHVEEGV